MSVILPYDEEPQIFSLLQSKYDLDVASILTPFVDVVSQSSEEEFIKSEQLSGIFNRKIEKNEIRESVPEVDTSISLYKRRCDQYNSPPVRYVIEVIERHKKKLDATGYGIDDLGIYFLNEALVGPPLTELTKLTLDFNYFGKVGCVALATYIEESSLKYLSLVGCKIGVLGAVALAGSLEKTRKLEYLNLSRCDLRDPGGVVIAKTMCNNRSIINLDLSFNKLYTAAGKEIGNMLAANKKLQILNLKWNELYPQDNSSKLIAKGLTVNTSIRELNLSWNGLSGTKFAREFSKYLRKTLFLRVLNLENNSLCDDELPYIIAGLQKCSTIKECYMGGNRWSNQSIAFFLVGVYPSLNVFSFGDQGLESSLYDLAQVFMLQPNKKIISGGKIRPNPVESVNFTNIVFDRIKILAKKTKKKKQERNMGHFMHLLLDQGKDLIKDRVYDRLYAEFNAKLDVDVARHLKDLYFIKSGKLKFVDVKSMAEAYLKRHPTAKPPPKIKVEPPSIPIPPPSSVPEKGKGKGIAKK